MEYQYSIRKGKYYYILQPSPFTGGKKKKRPGKSPGKPHNLSLPDVV